jgi:septum formation protein
MNPAPQIILASSSPRRIELLALAGVQARNQAPNVDEAVLSRETARAMVKRLARLKAESVSASFSGQSAVIIAADTTVVAPNGKTILGKPTDLDEARKMLRSIAGKTHLVHTGYCILSSRTARGQAKRIERIITSRVTLRPAPPALLEAYLKLGESMDKAGAYAAQGAGMSLIKRITGSYTNVVGLPMAELLEDLEKHFGVRSFGMGPS